MNNENITNTFYIQLSNSFAVLSAMNDVDEIYNTITASINQTAEENIPTIKKIQPKWQTARIEEAIKNKSDARKRHGAHSVATISNL